MAGRLESPARRRWRSILILAAAAVSLASVDPAGAGGTPPCTDIVNQATVTYTVGGATLTGNSNPTTTSVAELLDVSVVWQDAADVAVTPGDSARVLTFLVTNTGNGTEGFTLTGLSTLGGDDFDPVPDAIYLDDGDGLFDEGSDTPYTAGVNDPVLASEASITVFYLHVIPLAVTDGDLGNAEITATAATASGTPGDVVSGAGDCGSDAVVGSSGGEDEDTGTYVVSGIGITIVKSASVTDPFGGSEPVPGAVIRYTITVNAVGTGTATGVRVTDPIPASTTYSPGTLTLDASGLTDSADGDEGDVGDTIPGTVTVDLGTLTEVSPQLVITFDVVID